MNASHILPETKKCKKCGFAKEIIYFGTRFGVKGAHPWCKECSASHSKEWRKSHPDYDRSRPRPRIEIVTISTPDGDVQVRQCTKCKEIREVSSFYLIKWGNGSRHSWCNLCLAEKTRKWKSAHPGYGKYSDMSAPQKAAYYESQKKWLRNNPEQRKGFRLKSSFGIGISEYNAILDRQDGVCAVCRKPETVLLRGKLKSLCVDHCHKTGKIRGLLCTRCNTAIGYAHDDPSRLRACADYLECAK